MNFEQRLEAINTARRVIIRTWISKRTWIRQRDATYVMENNLWIIESERDADEIYYGDSFLINDPAIKARFLLADHEKREAGKIKITRRGLTLIGNYLKQCFCCGSWSSGSYDFYPGMGCYTSEDLALAKEDTEVKIILCPVCKDERNRGNYRLREILRMRATEKQEHEYLRDVFLKTWPEKPTASMVERVVRKVVRRNKWSGVKEQTKQFFKMLLGASRLAALTQNPN